MRVIILCRFIPGGRTAVTLTCGVTGYPRRRYLTATACAGMLWASYAFFLGRLGGQVFEGQLWIGLLLGLGLGLAVSVLIEIARRMWQWHTRRGRRLTRPVARLAACLAGWPKGRPSWRTGRRRLG